eukprot:CAMPEP_0170168098 /NCGR_PEP_ID=MMETSP0040_2-20121228/1277_1 /TAXON_ID=641309 /ORGANISM="Lotharella oceanica, Strain CCMP622" /LENGTH=154 /DNA_ID=CAMNT_0010406285 /DNA_START=111 /DNA_END=575 /DNA_ORIENTATION=+
MPIRAKYVASEALIRKTEDESRSVSEDKDPVEPSMVDRSHADDFSKASTQGTIVSNALEERHCFDDAPARSDSPELRQSQSFGSLKNYPSKNSIDSPAQTKNAINSPVHVRGQTRPLTPRPKFYLQAEQKTRNCRYRRKQVAKASTSLKPPIGS